MLFRLKQIRHHRTTSTKKAFKMLMIPFLLLFSLNIALPIEACGEMFISGYLGFSSTLDSDVELNRPGGTNLTFSDVSWDDKSFESPPYYGLRVGYWFKDLTNWAAAIDFTHAKMVSDLGQTVSVSSTLNGTPVSGQERLGDTFEVLEFTDGHNLITLNGMYRWMDLGTPGTFFNRLQPYVLVGLGIAYPHAEVTIEGDRTFEFQNTGLAAQAGDGLDVDITRLMSVFAEYRLSYAEIDAELVGGGTLKTEPWTRHFNLGVTVSFFH